MKESIAVSLVAAVLVVSCGALRSQERNSMASDVKTRDALARSDSWMNHDVDVITPSFGNRPPRTVRVTAKIVDYLSPLSIFSLAVILIERSGNTFLIDGRRMSVEGRETFYIDQGDELIMCAVGAGFVYFSPSVAKTGTIAGGLNGVIAHFAETIDDKQLLASKTREVTLELRKAAPAEMWRRTASSAFGAHPTIVEKDIDEAVLHLELESPSKRIRQGFWIDLKEHKLVRTSAPYSKRRHLSGVFDR